MSKVYQSITAPVRKIITLTDTRYVTPRVLEYGVKSQLKKWYIYIKNPNNSVGWVKAHGPFEHLPQAIWQISKIQQELEEAIDRHNKLVSVKNSQKYIGD